MSQASISKNLYRMKVFLPYTIYFIFLFFLTSVITFLIFTGKTANNMKDATSNGANTETNIINSSDSLYRDLSFQAVVISLLTIITFCMVFTTLKTII
jgi:hypothetical protein